MKKFLMLLFLVTLALWFSATEIYGAGVQGVIVTPADWGTDIPRYTAQNGNAPAYTTLGNIVIYERDNKDIRKNQPDVTLILTAPTNWVFNAGVGSYSFVAGRDISAMSISVTTTQIVLTFSTPDAGGDDKKDSIVISGIQVQAVDGNITTAVNILRAPSDSGTAVIKGIIAGTTNFGTLSLDEGTPLPVELTSLAAIVKNYSVQLKWETATEVSNYGFEIERSADKINWSKIAFIEGHGNSNSTKQYSYTDSKISSGKYYYRLKQIDNEGTFAYSKEIEVTAAALLTDFTVEQNFPNPFNPTTTIKFGFQEPVNAQVVIYNAVGAQVAVLFNERTEAGKIYSVDFDGSQFASGIYYYAVTGGNFKSIKKMILMK